MAGVKENKLVIFIDVSSKVALFYLFVWAFPNCVIPALRIMQIIKTEPLTFKKKRVGTFSVHNTNTDFIDATVPLTRHKKSLFWILIRILMGLKLNRISAGLSHISLFPGDGAEGLNVFSLALQLWRCYW